MDLDRVTDFEQMKRIAQTAQTQVAHLLKILEAQSRRINELVGGDAELQRSLALLEKMRDSSN